MGNTKRWLGWLGFLAVGTLTVTAWRISQGAGGPGEAPGTGRYPYHSPAFTRFVDDSYDETGAGSSGDFYQWMESACSAPEGRLGLPNSSSLEEDLDRTRLQLQPLGTAKRAQAVRSLCERLHRVVKRVIPRFSLDRGFEFANVVQYGERQCFLQSVLIAGLLQRAGVDAGVVMVYRNIEGRASNNGHATALVKLPDGTDLLVDASEPEPFPRHQGLYLRAGGYRFVVPQFKKNDSRIERYQLTGSGKTLETKQARPLDIPFLRSQFAFYRGERAPGGILASRPTPGGLEASAAQLRKSHKLDRQNALAVYTLGRVFLKQGKKAAARQWIDQACHLYSEAGWVPDGPRGLLAQVSTERPPSPAGENGG